MTLTLPPDIEKILVQEAEQKGIAPEALALTKLHSPAPIDYRDTLLPPRDEWQRQWRSIGIPCGVFLTDEQLSREVMYEDHL